MQSLQRAQLSQTIVALSTARGPGAISIVRLSGNQALAIGRALGCIVQAQQPYKLTRVLLHDPAGAPLDDAMAVAMPGPNSFTGEDVLELHVHGGDAVVDAVLTACFTAGARSAEPGEFTLRAFTHGRLDLAQAEAVGALIHAQSQEGRARALSALQGKVSAPINAWLHRLEGVAAAWLAQLDFPDDTLGGPGNTPHEQEICREAHEGLELLLGRMAQDDDQPPHVVLMGAVNTGKSTLTNALCGFERALVDEQAGTTRDTIEVPLRWRHQRLHLWDTAGQRPEAEGVEARGIALGTARAQEAALVLWLCDGTDTLWPSLELLQKDVPVLLFGARADRLDEAARHNLQQQAKSQELLLQGFVSGKTGEGLDALRKLVCGHLARGKARSSEGLDDGIMGNLRHRQQLQVAIGALGDTLHSMQQQMPLDLLLTDLQLAVRALGEIVGRDVDAQVIDRIFSDFCIGK